jgi:hypothetical protein
MKNHNLKDARNDIHNIVKKAKSLKSYCLSEDSQQEIVNTFIAMGLPEDKVSELKRELVTKDLDLFLKYFSYVKKAPAVKKMRTVNKEGFMNKSELSPETKENTLEQTNEKLKSQLTEMVEKKTLSLGEYPGGANQFLKNIFTNNYIFT